MKKYLRYIPNIIVFILFLTIGAIGKLTGNVQSIELFKTLNIFEAPEHFARYAVGITELIVALGVLSIKTEKIAAFIGMLVMIVALYFHITVLGGIATGGLAILGLVASGWILFRK